MGVKLQSEINLKRTITSLKDGEMAKIISGDVYNGIIVQRCWKHLFEVGGTRCWTDVFCSDICSKAWSSTYCILLPNNTVLIVEQ